MFPKIFNLYLLWYKLFNLKRNLLRDFLYLLFHLFFIPYLEYMQLAVKNIFLKTDEF